MAFKIKQITPLLLVADLENAIAFYVHQLGFTVGFRYDDFYAGIEKDGYTIHLKIDYNAPREPIAKTSSEELDLLFSVEDAASVFEEISKKDVEIIQPLREMPYGTEFYIADPDGHVIAFVS
ncbi:hypothetical protein SAMN04487996_11311 [Dyadobacter soli]|uniref:VOC domain-containing protein n=1 Tax=Dyadobacter soli TaxID=659014 RepID=A0A1G7PH45_9BACT|nr:VOC family protein [Dyadobacter soli]SDF85682.1 hypothetical protein SAMN04487996_11311 [Dyadobacter soli]